MRPDLFRIEAFDMRFIYQAGDDIVLKAGISRAAQNAVGCRIISVLPSAYGLAQYRVRYAGETCERRITEEDIDFTASSPSAARVASPRPSEKTSWITSSQIRTRK